MAIDKEILARMVGMQVETTSKLVDELTIRGVLSISADGSYFSRRMVKDEYLRNERAKCGAMGGNPSLGVDYNTSGFVYLMTRNNGEYKIGISQNPEKRA